MRDFLLRPDVTQIHGLGLRRNLARAMLMGQSKVDSDRQRCRRLSCNCVTMVQSTESREGVDCALGPTSDRYWSAGWRILLQPEMRPIFMVIAHILGQQPLEVLLIQDDHMVHQVSAATSDPALSN